MPFLKPRDVVMHYEVRPGAPARPAIVFANSLGTDFRIWDAVVTRVPSDVTVLRLDKRGHGLSEHGPVTLETLGQDVTDLLDACDIDRALICGVSVGGMIAQYLAATASERVAGALLCATSHRIGDRAGWQSRLSALDDGGIEGMADAILERWFAARFRRDHPIALRGYRAMLTRTPLAGYRDVCTMIRDTDLTDLTRTIRCPVQCIAGGDDLAVPVAGVESMAALIPGATVHMFDGVGHLPCLEAPGRVADLLIAMHGTLR